MRVFRDISIRHKLVIVIMLISGAALLLACASFLTYDFIMSRHMLINNLMSHAEIIGANSTAALTFDDPDSAKEILAALGMHKNIVYACIYRSDGEMFAEYRRHDVEADIRPPEGSKPSHHFVDDYLDIIKPIILDDKNIGTVFLRSDLEELNSCFRRFIIIMVLIIIGSLLVVFVLSSKFQKVISQPILYLSNTAREISSKKEYSIRAVKHQNRQDEIGQLVNGFNEMLEQIEKRDASLREARVVLENRVEERTEELQKTVKELGQEVSERRKAQEALLATEERFREMTELLPVVVFECDLKMGITYFNRMGFELFGYSEDKIEKGLSFLQIVAPEDSQKAVMNVERVCRGEIIGEKEYIALNINKVRFPIFVEFVPIYRDGIPTGVRGIIQDISEHRQREDELEGSRQAALSIMEDAELARKDAERERDRIEAMLKSIGDGVLVVNTDQKIIMINHAAEKITGWTNEEAFGKSAEEVFNIINEETGQEVASPLVQVFAEKKVVELTNHTALIRKDGITVPIADSGAPITDKEGRIIGAILVFRDVSEKAKAEEDRKELQSQLFQSQKMESIGILAGGIAHDFNNLLQGILGYASMIKTRLDDNDENYPHLNLIQLAAERAAELTQQLLSFARKGKYDVVSIDPETIIDQVVSISHRTFDKNVEVVKDMGKDLYSVSGDKAQVHQALMNVCINASEAMPDGGRLTIKTENLVLNENDHMGFMETSPGKYVVFTFIDNGHGMDQETMKRIFEPFFTTKALGKGTGLGLSMVFGVVENHGGSIEVVSEPGEGSTFRLLFPAEEHPETREVRTQDTLKIIAADEKFYKPEKEKHEGLVLIVDDEDIVRYLASDMLQVLGYRTLMASDGREAVETYKERSKEIDLVLLDMIMPKMGGLETLNELKKLDPEVKVIVSSGYEQDERSQRIMQEGAILYLKKPYMIESLSKAIQQAFDKDKPVEVKT